MIGLRRCGIHIYIYGYNGYNGLIIMDYYCAIKHNEILPFAAKWMGLEIITLSEVSQAEKDKYYMISLICRI